MRSGGPCRTSSTSHADHYLILAGDHLYRMDFDEMVQAHVASGADITIAAQPTNADDARGMGIFRFDRKGQIEGFEEKPSAARLEEMGGSLPAGASTDFTTPADKPFVASMGIYVFTRKALVEALARGQRRRLRPRDHPEGARPPEGARLRVQRLLGRRRHAALVLRRQHQLDAARRRVQLLPPDAAGLLAAALPAAVLGRWRLAVPHRRLGWRLGRATPRSRTRSSACACRSRRARR